MPRQTSRLRPLTVALAVLSWLAVGLSVPILHNAFDPRLQIDVGSVVAADLESHVFATPTVLDVSSGLTARSGRLAFVGRQGQPLTHDNVASFLKNGGGQLELTRGSLVIGEETSRSSVAPNAEAAPSPLVRQLNALAFETLNLRDTSIELHLPGGQQERLSAANITITPRRGHQFSAVGTALWRGQHIEVDAIFGGQDAAASSRGRYLRVHIKSPLIDTTFEGRASRSGTLALIGQSQSIIPDLRKFARELGIGWQGQAGLRDVKLSGKFSWIDDSLAFETAQVQIDGQHAHGALAIRTAGRRPLISGTLDFMTLDLAHYISMSPAGPQAKPAAVTSNNRSIWSTEGLWSRIEDILRLPVAQSLDADMRISAKELSFAKTRFGRAAASVALRRGQFIAQIAEIEIGRGSGSGQISANLNSIYPRFSLLGRLDKIELAELTGVLLQHRPLQGAGTVQFDLKAEGATVQDMMRGLEGSIELDMEPGARLALDLSQFWQAPNGLDANAHARLLRSAQRGSLSLESLQGTCAIEGVKIICGKIEGTAGDRGITASLTYNAEQARYDSSFAVVRKSPNAPKQAGTDTGNIVTGSIQPPATRTFTVRSSDTEGDNGGVLLMPTPVVPGDVQDAPGATPQRRKGT